MKVLDCENEGVDQAARWGTGAYSVLLRRFGAEKVRLQGTLGLSGSLRLVRLDFGAGGWWLVADSTSIG
jgi:hypothetical protein